MDLYTPYKVYMELHGYISCSLILWSSSKVEGWIFKVAGTEGWPDPLLVQLAIPKSQRSQHTFNYSSWRRLEVTLHKIQSWHVGFTWFFVNLFCLFDGKNLRHFLQSFGPSLVLRVALGRKSSKSISSSRLQQDSVTADSARCKDLGGQWSERTGRKILRQLCIAAS